MITTVLKCSDCGDEIKLTDSFWTKKMIGLAKDGFIKIVCSSCEKEILKNTTPR